MILSEDLQRLRQSYGTHSPIVKRTTSKSTKKVFGYLADAYLEIMSGALVVGFLKK